MSPLAGLALAVAVVVPEEILAVAAGDLLAGADGAQHLVQVQMQVQVQQWWPGAGASGAGSTLTQALSLPVAMNLQLGRQSWLM